MTLSLGDPHFLPQPELRDCARGTHRLPEQTLDPCWRMGVKPGEGCRKRHGQSGPPDAGPARRDVPPRAMNPGSYDILIRLDFLLDVGSASGAGAPQRRFDDPAGDVRPPLDEPEPGRRPQCAACRGRDGTHRPGTPRPGRRRTAGPAPAPSPGGRAREGGARLRGRGPGGARRAPPPGRRPYTARRRSPRSRSSHPRTAAPQRCPRRRARARRPRGSAPLHARRMPASGSSAVTSAPARVPAQLRARPRPISSTRPRACAASRRRQPPTAARSNGHITRRRRRHGHRAGLRCVRPSLRLSRSIRPRVHARPGAGQRIGTAVR